MSAQPPLMSVDDLKPIEEGGAVARTGFAYQDEIAVRMVLRMLSDPDLLQVSCETQDDLVLVHRASANTRRAEFVQVKAGEPNKLWSVADVCRKSPTQSIYEKSLLKDQCAEESWFRLVTLRQVAEDVRVLTLPFDSPARAATNGKCSDLCKALETKYPSLKSSKGNGSLYWVQHCLWEHGESETSVSNGNLLAVLRLSTSSGQQLLPQQADVLLDELRTWVKDASVTKWDVDRKRKVITSTAVASWWQRRLNDVQEQTKVASGGRLNEKLELAKLPPDVRALAAELRRKYSAAVRTPRYMQTEDSQRLQQRVQAEVLHLRAQFVAGHLKLTGPQFHAHCVERLQQINTTSQNSLGDQTAFLHGCMYDIADRCLLRFDPVQT